jgi:hypothetical protein
MRSRAPGPSGRLNSPAFSAAAVGVLLLAGGFAFCESGLPAVRIQYRVEDQGHYLIVAADPAVQQRAIAEACESAGRRWPFLQWSASPQTPQPPTWTVKVTVTPKELKDGPGEPSRGGEVRVKHLLEVGGQAEEPGFDQLLYDAFEPQPGPTDTATMTDDLIRVLKRQLPSLLEGPEFGEFISRIPLGGRIKADPERQRLLILLDAHALQAKLQTQLEAQLSGPDQASCTMNLEIRREVREESDLDGCIQARITWCNAPEVATVPTDWDPALPALIGGYAQEQLFMLNYRPAYFQAASDTGIVESASPAPPVRCVAGRQP